MDKLEGDVAALIEAIGRPVHLVGHDWGANSGWLVAAHRPDLVRTWTAAKPGGRFERGLRNGGMTEADVGRFRREIVDDGALTGALNWYRAMPYTDQRSIADPVTVPTTLVWSDADVAVRRIAVDRCTDYVTGSYELVVLEGVSHWIPTQAPDALAAAIVERISSVRA